MGLNACEEACRWLLFNTQSRTVVDPFCGRGSVLAMANKLGFAAVGVDLSAKRCSLARRLVLRDGDATVAGAEGEGDEKDDSDADVEAEAEAEAKAEADGKAAAQTQAQQRKRSKSSKAQPAAGEQTQNVNSSDRESGEKQ